ncbi:MAG: hypothetical protein WEE36_08715 [Acidimicrobiia bacterium]
MTAFTAVERDWLDLMWCLDAFRQADLKPPTMQVKTVDALNRKKGDWFAELIALLLQNRTSQGIGARTKIQGFSQYHQIDVAWPSRKHDPLICIETKVTGAPAVTVTQQPKPPRNATADWSNRRKELKFAATDLKLYRRQRETSIEHWDVWRADAPPKTYFVWAARINPPADDIGRMADQLRQLTETYLDGAALIAWTENTSSKRYDRVSLATADRVRTVDDLLHRISTQIKTLAPEGQPPKPVVHDTAFTDD